MATGERFPVCPGPTPMADWEGHLPSIDVQQKGRYVAALAGGEKAGLPERLLV
jgi:hypothetical protein